jgi:hypothetical protein
MAGVRAPIAAIFLFTLPGSYRMGTRYSLCSDYRTCFLSVRSSVQISVLLIGSIRGLHQLISVNELNGLRQFISSQIHYSQSSGHQTVCKLRLSWQITRTRMRQRVTVTQFCTLSTSVGSFSQCERKAARRNQRKKKEHIDKLRNCLLFLRYYY